MSELKTTSRTMKDPSIPPTLIPNNSVGSILGGGFQTEDISIGIKKLELGINNAKAESQELRAQTDSLMVQTAELHTQTAELTAHVDEARKQTDDLTARTDKLREQIDDLMLTREFRIHLTECFQEYPQFTNPKTGKINKYKMPIQAYCPTVYWGRTTKNGQFLREIHIKISADNFHEYATKYDFDAANDILLCVIKCYKQKKRMRIIAKDESDGVEYWYFQLQVADNQECSNLAKQIVSEWLQIVFKQPLQDICPVNY